MEQVLFWLPIRTGWTPNGIPVYGFGLMLCFAFVLSAWLAGRRGLKVGIPGDKFQDVILWLLLGGVIGGRILYIIAEDGRWENFFQVWNGGLVFYGGAIGATITAYIAYRRILKPLNVSAWQVADALAPAAAIGLCLGRLGCFLNGCCWGYVAAPGYPAVHFPSLTAPARDQLVCGPARESPINGKQTLAGFTMNTAAADDRTIGLVEYDSAAATAGLRPGDIILRVNGRDVKNFADFEQYLAVEWMRGEKDMNLTVQRGSANETIAFRPRLIGLYPTQLYESISALLLMIALIATWPVRSYDGQLIVLLMLAYAIHRFVNEMLRVDTPPYYGLTLSQWISVAIFSSGIALALLRKHQIRRANTGAKATNLLLR